MRDVMYAHLETLRGLALEPTAGVVDTTADNPCIAAPDYYYSNT